ncbi:Gfo/Idh/MocA family oxidoreductase, partial [Nocardia farcinica]|uniref:Gfo/Idh/MocA family oxidoreductase n=1 Tax=Nocardia farcinica TaxID=37329 RepID=UPI00313E4A36
MIATEPTPVPATPRVVVCGTSFGRVYLRAVQADPDVELAGIVSRGSATSREIAKTSGVPHYCGVDELPGDIDIACVAVRAGDVQAARPRCRRAEPGGSRRHPRAFRRRDPRRPCRASRTVLS